jgi:hypothetical protein
MPANVPRFTFDENPAPVDRAESPPDWRDLFGGKHSTAVSADPVERFSVHEPPRQPPRGLDGRSLDPFAE